MIRYLGILGIVGLLLAIAGVGVIAYVDPLIAAGLVGVLVGMSVVVISIVRRAMASFGIGGMI